MDRIVIDFDLSSLPANAQSARPLLDALVGRPDTLFVTVSAFEGVDGWIAASFEEGGAFNGPLILGRLRDGHRALARALGGPAAAREAACLRIDRIWGGLCALVSTPPDCTRTSSHRTWALAAGERLAATCVALALASLGKPCALLEGSEFDLRCSSDQAIREEFGALPGAVIPGRGAASRIAEALGAELVFAPALSEAPWQFLGDRPATRSGTGADGVRADGASSRSCVIFTI